MARVFGRSMIDQWMLDPTVTYLNHGTVGAPPIPVIARWRALQDEIELQPAQFLLRELADIDAVGKPAQPRMRVAAQDVADFVGCEVEQFGFVDNATTGCNAVLRSFPFERGDEILVTNLGYGGVNRAVDFTARQNGCTVRTIDLPRPGAEPHEFTAAVEAALRPESRMLVVDHITSQTALVLPLAEIAAACHRHGVVVLADGAHAPGAIDLDVDSLGVDFYVANLHKWLWTPRSCGFVWAAEEHVSNLHPTVISWGYGNGLAAEFDLLGTRDPSPFLTAPFAIELWKDWGGTKILAYNHDLVLRSAQRLADAWGTEFDIPPEMIGPMAYVALPAEMGSTRGEAVALQESLLADDRIEVPVFADEGRLTCRISAQIYNDDNDFVFLADAVKSRC
ncbi:MAG: aminotransferase class V-fold PLP-dependent enzyme [Ilumatobacteraceae bacterium]